MKWLSNNKKRVLYFSIVGVVLLIGVSYAVWVLTYNQANPNVAMSACFDLSFTEANDISLVNAYPMTDEEGKTLTPYTFTIKNKCSDYASYQVNLEVLNNSTLDSSYVKSEFNDRVKLVSAYPVTTKTLNNASTAYKLIQGYLNPNESITYNLKLWIDYNSTADQSANKTYESKITIASTYKGTNPSELEECIKNYGENSLTCMIMASADPENSKCLKTKEDGSILESNTSKYMMKDSDTPIVCTMEDDYGTSYYLRGNHQNSNVKFAGMCWKIIRTTGSGGIKLLYNGDLDENGKCTNTSGTHLGFSGQTYTLTSNKVYGTSYTYDGEIYTLNDTSTLDWSTDSASIIGKYTCGNTNTSCNKLFLVIDNYNSSSGYVLRINSGVNYSTIGKSSFNSQSSSPSYVGYMYNSVYNSNARSMTTYKSILHEEKASTSNYYYGDTISYSGGQYYITNQDGSNVTQLSWTDNYTTLPGKFTCRGTSKYNDTTLRCSTAYKVIDTTTKENYMIAEYLIGGELTLDIKLAPSYSYNGVEYILENPINVNGMEWYNNYNDYKNYFVCDNHTQTSCNQVYKITAPFQKILEGEINVSNNYFYGESFTYNEGSESPYILNNTVQFYDINDANNKSSLDTHHYTCFKSSDNTCQELYYIFYLDDYMGRSFLYYIKLIGNETVEDALNKMVSKNDVNVKDSTIKRVLEWWYEQNIKDTPYENKLENVLFCNNRTITKNIWSPSLILKSFMIFSPSTEGVHLKCDFKRDAFSAVDTTYGNGFLKYSIGLLTTSEGALSGSETYLKNGIDYWTISPDDFSFSRAVVHYIDADGSWIANSSYGGTSSRDNGIRPVIALKPTTQFKTGTDGTALNPYEIE